MSREFRKWPRVVISLTLLMGSAVIPLGMGACSGDKVTTPNRPDSSSGVPSILIGTWKLQSATVAGMSVPLGTVFNWPSNTTAARIRLSADSSLVYEELNAQGTVVRADTARFSIVADRFLVTPGVLPSDSGNWSVTGSDLDLTGNYLGYNYDLKATKSD
jgi:hypothetical protein